MSKLEEMRIQGIRSFGPENPQRISFSTPVTLILGPNGTGKTTIIECLKYAVTGELPPGAKTGASFIHDPKLTGSVEVKAKVALKVKDVRNCSMVAARNLVATQRGMSKAPSLKTLDGAIKRVTSDGEVTSRSLRVGEMDTEMVNSLGASKAVFENVIFCHQEDSNWPLQEAKSVKERFDDLFASSRYVKALDALRKSRTDLEAKAREYRAELKHLARSKNEANQIQHRKVDKESDLEGKMEQLSQVDKELDPICAQLTLYRKRYKELVEYQANAKSLCDQKRNLEESLKELNNKITKKFEGSDEELNEAIGKADEQLAEWERSLVRNEMNLKQIRSSIKANDQAKDELIIRKTRLDIAVQRLNEALKKRNEVIGKMAVKMELTDIADKFANERELSISDVETVKGHLEDAIKVLESHLNKAKGTLASDGRKAQSKIDESRSALARVQQSITNQESTLSEIDKEWNDFNCKLKRAASANSELEDVKKKLDEATRSRELLKSSESESEIKKSIERAQTERNSYEDQIAHLDVQIDKAQQNAMAIQKRVTLESDRMNAIEAAKKLRSRHLDQLELIFAGEAIPQVCVKGEKSANSLTREFNKRFEKLVSESKAIQNNLNVMQKELSKLETQMSFHRKQLREKQDTMRKIEESLISTCGRVNLEHSLDALIIRKKQLESDCATEEGSLYLWKKFRDRLAKESDCPLCHRGFTSEQDHIDLKEEIERRIVSIPVDLDCKRKELQEITSQHEKIIELRPKSEEFSNLREIDIPALDQRIKSTQLNLDVLQSKMEKETSTLADVQMKESVARKLQGDMAVIEKTEQEIGDLNRSLDACKASHGELTQRPLEEIQEQRQSLREKCKDLSSRIEGLRTEMEQLSKQRQNAIDKEHELKDRHLKLEKEFQAVSTLNSELKRLEASKERTTNQLEKLRAQLAGCQANLTAAEAEKRKISEEREESVAFATTEWQEWRDRSREFMEACELVASKYKNNSSPTEELQKVVCELAKLEAKREELKSGEVETSEEVEQLRTAINTHQIVQRDLQDCVQLRKIQSQLGSLSNRIRDIQGKITACQSGISESTDPEEHVKELSNQEERLRQKKQVINDGITRVKTELQMMEKDLKEKYADAETEYLKKMYELRTSEMAATDLHRYHQALDRAIMKYHEEKMNEINAIIRELWRTTYRGNDIDHIKICSEEESLAAASRTRRTYNYRVVMVKAGSGGGAVPTRVGKYARLTTSSETPLDMRGRCSAGQKVLASLVIRLALAEVFCLQCGVLALDEPTTNLDRENIESLAYALTEIIKARSSQRNFQLIVITHDEDFIELLGRAGCANHLQRLVRNPEGLSEIQTVRMEDQFN
nr:dna repair protein rad50 [Hymenolepis microstoma]